MLLAAPHAVQRPLETVPGPPQLGQDTIIVYDRQGKVTALPVPGGAYQHPRVSPDGKWLAVETHDGNETAISLYELTAGGEYQLLFEPYDFRASYAGPRVYRRLLQAGVRQSLAFTTERATARRLAAGSRLVLLVGLNKRPDRQINYGSGKDVNSETIADAGRPVRVRWHGGSHVEIQSAVRP